MQDDQLLTPREASRQLGVTVPTLALWARTGRLPAAYTPGGHRRYRLTDVQTLQAEREREHPEPKNWENDAARLYQQGWSIRQVAQRFDCDYGTMRRVLLRRTTLRTRGNFQRTQGAESPMKREDPWVHPDDPSVRMNSGTS